MKKFFNAENIGFAGIQWSFWSAYCTLFAFLVLYLKDKEYNEIQIGIIMSAISITSIIGQPFWGHYSDRNNTFRNVIAGCMLAAGLVAFLIPLFFRSFLLVILACLVISFTENSIPSIIDSWTLNNTVHKPWIDYGLTRGMGSLGYAITAVLFGIILDRYGYKYMFYIHFFLVLVTVGFCFFVDQKNKSFTPEVAATPSDTPPPRFNIFASRRFLWFLLSSTLVFIGFRATAIFFPLLLSQKGGDNKAVGLALSVMALSEVPVLFFSKRLLSKYKDTALITLSMGFFILRILLHIVMPSVSGLIVIQATQALSFALFLPAAVYYVKRISPIGLGSTYLTVAASCYFGIGGILGSFLGGLLIDLNGIYNMFWWCIAVTIAGLLVFVLSQRKNDSN